MSFFDFSQQMATGDTIPNPSLARNGNLSLQGRAIPFGLKVDGRLEGYIFKGMVSKLEGQVKDFKLRPPQGLVLF